MAGEHRRPYRVTPWTGLNLPILPAQAMSNLRAKPKTCCRNGKASEHLCARSRPGACHMGSAPGCRRWTVSGVLNRTLRSAGVLIAVLCADYGLGRHA